MTTPYINLHHSDAGQGIALVFLHGFPLSRRVWLPQIEALRSAYRVIAPDLRGFGDSAAPSGPTSMAQYAADVRALLDALAPGPVVLIGHSMGGYVALAFAHHFPALLRGLVLIGTKAGPDTAEAAAGRRATAEQVRLNGVQALIEAMAPKMLAPSHQDERTLAQVRGIMGPAKPDGVIAALLAMAERPDAAAYLPQIAVPTLVITGADDALIPPAESESLAQAIRGAQLSVIPDAGHLVAFEQPDTLNRALAGWLVDRVVPQGGGEVEAARGASVSRSAR